MDAQNDIIDNGMTVVYAVPAGGITDLSAPTVSEIEAGERISPFLTTDGLVGFEPDTGDVDNTSIESTFGTNKAGRPNFSGVMLRLKKQSGQDDAVHELLQYRTQVDIVIRRHTTAAESLASGQAVQVYPFECGETRYLPPEGSGDAVARYEVPGKIFAQPNQRAQIATSA